MEGTELSDEKDREELQEFTHFASPPCQSGQGEEQEQEEREEEEEEELELYLPRSVYLVTADHFLSYWNPD